MVPANSWRTCFTRRLFFPVVALAVFCLPLHAQTFRGSIVGTVSDPSGAAVVGATVAAKNTATGVVRTTQSTGDGTYSIPELPIGTYEVTATMTGFGTAVATGVSVEIARDRRVDFSLRPGSIAQRVEVTEQAVVLAETHNNNLGGTFVTKDLESLPTSGRDYTKLLIMVPGVSGDPSGEMDSAGSFGQFSSNGNRGRSNNFLLDGTDMNDSYRNDPAINEGGVFAIPSTILPLDAVAELRVLSNFDAEYGRNSGAVVNIVTRSGTNDLHGSVYEYFRNSVLNARNFFNTIGPKDAFRNNQFGATAGGPFVKDKTFWFFSYEGQREGFGLTSLNTVPALSDYQAAVAAIPGSNAAACATDIYTCVTKQPAGVINPVIVNFYNLCHTKGGCSGGNLPWPVANLAGNPSANNVSSDKSRNDLDSLIFKVDHNFSSREILSGRYFYGRSDQSVPLAAAGGSVAPNENTFVPTDVNLASISLVSVVSPTKVNEARFGYNRFHEDFFASDRTTFGNPAATFGLNNCLGNVTPTAAGTCPAAGDPKANPLNFGLPFLQVSGFTALGSSRFSNPRSRVDRNYHFLDDFSWKFAKNDVKFGYEFRHTSVDSLEDINYRGRLKFAGGLPGFLTGTVTGGQINYGDTQRFLHQDSHSLYIQDSYQLLPRLLVNAGIRWDFYGVIHEGINAISSYDPSVGLVAKSEPYPNTKNNFAPRLSLAWDVTGKGKTVVRAGTGVFFDTFSLDYFTGQIYSNTNNLGPAYNAIGSKPIFQGSAVTAKPLAVGVPAFDVSAAALGGDTTDASTVGRLRTPYVFNYTLNVQQELTKNTILQVGYVGTQGRRLQRIVDLGQPSQAAITAFDVTCVGGLNISLTNCPAGIPGTVSPPCVGESTGVPRNFNNAGPGTVILPGQNNTAAVMSSLAPQTPCYLQQLQTTARSAYNSLQISLTQRNWHGITQQLSYTWSHSIDDASDGQDYVPHAGQPNDSTNPHASNVGDSNFDTRHHFVWAVSYAIPKWEAGGRFGSGWSVASLVSIISGHPFELQYTADDYDGSGEFFGRPDVIGPIKYNYNNPTRFLDLSAFALPCTLDGKGTAPANCLSGTRHFGTLGRNSLLGPPLRQWDLSLVKDTKVSERMTLQLRADVFNVFNHPNFANPLWPSSSGDLSPFASPDVNGRFRCAAGSAACATPGSQFFPILATADTGPGNPILGGGSPRSFQLAAKLIF